MQTPKGVARVLLGAVALLASGALAAPRPATVPAQAVFATPEAAVDALAAAAAAHDAEALRALFGPKGRDLAASGDPVQDRNAYASFVTAIGEAKELQREADGRVVLVVGQEKWPFPVPIVKAGEAWRFDTAAGIDEVRDRRVGANELATIQVCLAIVDAQREYASKDRNGDGVLEYAQRFASRDGQEDGLFWPAAQGEPESPLGPLVAQARSEGYTRSASSSAPAPYHGYVYRMLTAQGKHAPGGAYDYLVRGHLVGGFAVVAYPAEYGRSGVKTFLVSHEGVVFSQDLGPGTAKRAREMKRFDPGPGWQRE